MTDDMGQMSGREENSEEKEEEREVENWIAKIILIFSQIFEFPHQMSADVQL